MDSDRIEVTKYFKFKEPSALLAIFSFKMSFGKYGIGYINDAKIFQKNGHAWVKLPDKEYIKDGKKFYSPICGLLEKEAMQRFEKDLLQAVKEYVNRETPIPYPSPDTRLPSPPDDDGNLPF